MKIAVVTDSGTTISSHFGRAPYYLVFTVEDGKIVGREQRAKAGHQQFVQIEHEHHEHDHDHEHGHGFGAHSADKHTQMIDAMRDCEVVIVRGMGRGAYVSIQQANIRPILTDLKDAEAAVQAYIDGTLVEHPERLH
ncbi:MAG: NifB/NifX family molybdenum-iron cluster-binding protein [Anaerolineae bacterium]|nr:NifB/NifX family molybdenum-iron cluster-binding protein [Anaerolineae bacterium]MCA9907242.1 NifB/NifX family molybdenum-iron cluster-binding protein [Anaerolineae bacterium]